jgi:hypothetical protein
MNDFATYTDVPDDFDNETWHPMELRSVHYTRHIRENVLDPTGNNHYHAYHTNLERFVKILDNDYRDKFSKLTDIVICEYNTRLDIIYFRDKSEMIKFKLSI